MIWYNYDGDDMTFWKSLAQCNLIKKGDNKIVKDAYSKNFEEKKSEGLEKEKNKKETYRKEKVDK